MIALILELFLPGIGHFYIGKYWFGIVKLLLFLTTFSSSYYIYKELKIPIYIEAIREIILNNILSGIVYSCKGGINSLDVAQQLFNFSFHHFWIFYVVDVYLYCSRTYYDGNGVPLY